MTAAEAQLPPIREELDIHEGPNAADGSPTWVLHDPLAHRFYNVGHFEFQVLLRWELGNSGKIAESISRETSLSATSEDVDHVASFLASCNLLQAIGEVAFARLMHQVQAMKKGIFWWLIHNYLFFRIPLVRPDRFLSMALPFVRILWSTQSAILVFLCGITGISLLLRQWDSFIATFPFFFNLEGLIFMWLTINLAKIVHEFGHAFTARNFGCRVPTMGIAFLVMYPVFYTDVSDAWKLPSRRQRLLIGSAGIISEIALAMIACLAWSFLPDGPLRSGVFLLTSTTLVSTLLVNLSPFMRFDGYYLLSDILGVPNLQERAFGLAKWKLREVLFGFGDPRPEHFPLKTERILLLYAYSTWIYRFFLFLGIAVLVYYLFFKLLGIFLMGVEIVYFILAPIYRELAEWKKRSGRITMNLNTSVFACFIIAALTLFFFPWQGSVTAPAIWRAEKYSRIFVPLSSRLDAILVTTGSRVSAGQEIAKLASPDLDHDIAMMESKVDSLGWQVKFQGMSAELKERGEVLRRELESAGAELEAKRVERAKLDLRSATDGVVAEMLDPVTVGDWLPANELLAVVIDPLSGVSEGWVSERDLERVRPGMTGYFYPDDVGQPPFEVRVQSVDTASVKTLPEMYHASLYGGAIAVRETVRNGSRQLVPEIPVYRMVLSPVAERGAPLQIVRGTVKIKGDRKSLASGIWERVAGVIVREAWF